MWYSSNGWMKRVSKLSAVMCVIITVAASNRADAQNELRGEAIRIVRLTAPVTIDGRIEPGEWSDATHVGTWFETQPGDNIPPPVRNVGYIGFDDRFFYAAFEFDDPAPSTIRARIRTATASAATPPITAA